MSSPFFRTWLLVLGALSSAACSARQDDDPASPSSGSFSGAATGNPGTGGSNSGPGTPGGAGKSSSTGGASHDPSSGGAATHMGGAATSQAGSNQGAAGAPTVPAGVKLPAEFLDLSNWYLTLPTGVVGDPDDIFQPKLATFEVDPYFKIAATGVQFQANAGGVTTTGSHYPRSELREMLNGGADKAAWGVNDGKTHTMTLTTAVTHLPVVKPDVVAAQIHDAQDDIVMVRLEGTELFIEGNAVNYGALEASYQLGTAFTVRFQASGGHILVFYNDLTTPKLDIPSTAVGCYFKAGVYTHSNPEKGDAPTAYGEAIISALEVTHE